MQYQKTIYLLDNTPAQPTKFRTKNWVEINHDARGTYNKDSQIKFKTSMLKSSLCDYSEAYILVKGTIAITPVLPPAINPNNNDKEGTFRNCAPFTGCISKINNTQNDNTKDMDVVEYCDNFLKTSESLLKCYRGEPALTNVGAIKKLHVDDNSSASFKFKQKITVKTANGGTKDVEIMVLLIYLSNFWRIL